MKRSIGEELERAPILDLRSNPYYSAHAIPIHSTRTMGRGSGILVVHKRRMTGEETRGSVPVGSSTRRRHARPQRRSSQRRRHRSTQPRMVVWGWWVMTNTAWRANRRERLLRLLLLWRRRLRTARGNSKTWRWTPRRANP